MKRGINREQGAVLVVALIMLAMITFLVVAFVGFARFERASVTASMRRTQAEFVAGDSLTMAQRQAISGLTNTVPHGLLVSKRSGGDLVPVFLDGTGDGIQETESTYLNLNAERNSQGVPGDPLLQQSNPASGLVGDPEWVGLLRNPLEPHGPNNRFIARTAFMTVPVSQGLNVRYHHNPHFLSQTNYMHFREQNTSPRHIDLAAPLFHMDPGLFSNPSYSPYRYSGGLYEMGAAIGDAFYLSRPVRGFNEALGENRTTGGVPAQVAYWLQTSNNRNSLKDWLGGDGLGNRPYGFYQFMETFSAAELPEEKGGVDLSSINDEPTHGFAGIVAQQAGEHFLEFLYPHGLKSGQKLELTGGVRPMIWDPIDFTIISSSIQSDDEMKNAWLQILGPGGLIQTQVPHRLQANDVVELRISGVQGLRMVHKAQAGDPWSPVGAPLLNAGGSEWSAVRRLGVSGVRANDSLSIPFGLMPHAAWARWDADNQIWIPLLTIAPNPDPMETLPVGLQGAVCQLRFRHTEVVADPIPYFVKRWSDRRVSLHRSAELDNASRVVFGSAELAGKSLVGYANSKNFSVPSNVLLRNGSLVRIPVGTKLGADVAEIRDEASATSVFLLREEENRQPGDPVRYALVLPYGPHAGSRVYLKQDASMPVQVIHQLTLDPLLESVEQMVGGMLNESLETSGNGPAAEHRLAGVQITSPNGPFPFEFGLAGQAALGPWHHPEKGIPWSVARASSELDRIVQVAANVGDIYSEPGALDISGKDIVSFRGNGEVLPFGALRSDGELAAKIRYRFYQHPTQGESAGGLVFGRYRVCFQSTSPVGNGMLEGRVILLETNSGNGEESVGRVLSQGRVLGKSALKRVSLFGPLENNGGFWAWRLNELVWRDGFQEPPVGGQTWSWVGYDLRLSVESGRLLRVYLNGDKVIEYELPRRAPAARFGLWSATFCIASFTQVTPAIPLADVNPDWWNVRFRGEQGGGSVLPTYYKGVFRRDLSNRIYLSGLQRGERGSSWYNRESPSWIGVKDRGQSPGRNLMPALNEVSMRVVYHRPTGRLLGRVTGEAQVFQGATVLPYQLRMNWRLLPGGVCVPVYSDSNGVPQEGTPIALNEVFGGAVLPFNSAKRGLLAAVAGGLKPLTATGVIPRVDATLGVLSDVRVQGVQIRVDCAIFDNSTGRRVDQTQGILSFAGGRSLGNPSPPNERILAPVWNGQNQYNVGDVVLDPMDNHNYYRLVGMTPSPVDSPSRDPSRSWVSLNDYWSYRKIDISWQANDPLVNSRATDFREVTYAPSRLNSDGSRFSSQGRSRLWIPRNQIYTGDNFTAPNEYALGAGIGYGNQHAEPWGRGVNDPAIKDAGVYSAANWMFPDVLRGGIQNLGWVGQVHRGTPWQTLYLKSKNPGAVEVVSINDVTGEAITSGPHHLNQGDRVTFMGVKPAEWNNVTSLTNVTGTVNGGGARSLILDNPSGNALAGLAGNGELYEVSGLNVASSIWTDWAGTAEVQPLNDHRLVEAFRVSGGQPVRGRFDINNPSAIAWSGVLSGLSLPYAPNTRSVSGAARPRITGAYDSTRHTALLENKLRTDLGQKDVRWKVGLLDNINLARGTERFARVTDILRTSELTDESPYLADTIDDPLVNDLASYYASPLMVDEQDIERLPQQMLSLLKVGGRRLFQSYIFTEQLRPARQFNRPGSQGGPAVDLATGEVLNYEVVGQTARRVLFELVGAEDWHESLKRGHFGRSRNANGELEDLPIPHPKVLGEWPIRLDY